VDVNSQDIYVVYVDQDFETLEVEKYTNDTWSLVGGMSFTDPPERITSPAIAISPSALPHVVLCKGANELVSYTFEESNPVPFALERGDIAADRYALDIAYCNDHSYIVFSDATNGAKATVLEDGLWKPENVISDGAANASRLISANGNLYAAFRDEHNGGGATVMKKEGNNWVELGEPGFTEEIANDISVYGTRLALHVTSSGEVLLAYPVLNNDDGATVTIKVVQYHE
jgi:hypothetical protein